MAVHRADQTGDRGYIEPAFRCPDIREVSDPFAVGCRRFEAAVKHVGSDGGRLPLTQIGRQAQQGASLSVGASITTQRAHIRASIIKHQKSSLRTGALRSITKTMPDAAPASAAGRAAAVCGASASRPVAQPPCEGQNENRLNL
jgi:hypothetical protein